ncbi:MULTISPECIES: hypothetical protein [Prosthecochloris]|uniref:Uncharacterized protein n=1 Tax=Prosthecochloris marina TaxID=2017681 RepID=A0A317T846_9CHLB|nr:MULTISPECIES: hypothetical protein [Prosthecochloris]PWW81591.1 hypothetical protein CR164_09275 [Prosthecochloris marina]UZJ37037.1 hypothetical protein OO005_09790 [Prosthecochloris sp. SCSIO W1103]UZJ40017.1 hypothetical protein OO185_02640 [Prosthecochloris sp. SCSIO W1102]
MAKTNEAKIKSLNDRKIDVALNIQELYMELAKIDAEILRAGGMIPVGGTIGGTIGGVTGGTIGGTVGGTIGGTIGGTMVDIAGTIGATGRC